MLAVVIAVVVWTTTLKQPSAGIENVTMVWDPTKISSGKVPINITANLWVNNPNGWPLSGEILKANADVYSIDKSDSSSPALELGVAGLGGHEVDISTHTNRSFAVYFQAEVGAAQSVYLQKDCITPGGTTRIAVNLTEIEVKIWNNDVKLDSKNGLKLPLFNATVPCPKMVSSSLASASGLARKNPTAAEPVLV